MALFDSPRPTRSFTSLSLALATSQGPENAAPGWLQVPAVSPQPHVHMSCLPIWLTRSVVCTGACAKRGAATSVISATREKQILVARELREVQTVRRAPGNDSLA